MKGRRAQTSGPRRCQSPNLDRPPRFGRRMMFQAPRTGQAKLTGARPKRSFRPASLFSRKAKGRCFARAPNRRPAGGPGRAPADHASTRAPGQRPRPIVPLPRPVAWRPPEGAVQRRNDGSGRAALADCTAQRLGQLEHALTDRRIGDAVIGAHQLQGFALGERIGLERLRLGFRQAAQT